MSPKDLSTTRLLRLCQDGDKGALEHLLDLHYSTIHSMVSRRLGPKLKARYESGDIIQESMLRVLKYGIPIGVCNHDTFQRFMARVVQNTIGDHSDLLNAARRDMAREQLLPDQTFVHLDIQPSAEKSPASRASDAEEQAMLRVALELLRANDRAVWILRVQRALKMAEVAKELSISREAADKRYRRASSRLVAIVSRLQRDGIGALLDEVELAEGDAGA